MSFCRNCFNSLCRSCCPGSSCTTKSEDNEDQVMSKIILYEHANFKGEKLELTAACAKLGDHGFNDKVSSIKVEGGNWTVYDHVNYGEPGYDLAPGEYPTWDAWGGKNDELSSAKPTD